MSKYLRKETYPAEFILDLYKGEPLTLDGDVITPSSRYHLFKYHGRRCIKCGIIGHYFAKERDERLNSQHSGKFHLNLYNLSKNGKETMITKDHIKPKSLGGRNSLSNYQTMCQPCNGRKGNKI